MKIVFLIALLAVFSNALTVSTPTDNYVNNSATVTFTFTPSLNASNCTIYANDSGGVFLQKASVNASNETTNTVTATLLETTCAWNVFCEATINESTTNYTITIDLTSPNTLAVTNVTNTTTINLSYSAADALSGIAYYEVYKNNSLLYNATTTNYADYAISSGNSYNYKMKAFDYAGNNAEQTLNLSFNPTTVITTKTATPGYTNSTISWTLNVAANKTLKYGTNSSMLNSTNSSSSSTTTQTAYLSSLAHSTTYYYNITACNTSCVELGPYSFTTLTPTAPTYANIVRTGTKAGSTITISINWTVGLGATSLGYYTFSTDNTGTWANSTPVSFGSGLSRYSNTSFTLNNSINKTLTRWIMYANDSLGMSSNTSIQNIIPLFPEPSPTAIQTTATPIPSKTPKETTATPTTQPSITPSINANTPTPTVVPTITPTSTPSTTKNDEGKENQSSQINAFMLVDANGVKQDKTNLAVDLDKTPSTKFIVNFSNQENEGEFFLELIASNNKNTTTTTTQPTTIGKNQSFLFAANIALPQGKVTIQAKIRRGNETISNSTLQINVESSKQEFDFSLIIVVIGAIIFGGFIAFKKLGKNQEKTEQKKKELEEKPPLKIKWKSRRQDNTIKKDTETT